MFVNSTILRVVDDERNGGQKFRRWRGYKRKQRERARERERERVKGNYRKILAYTERRKRARKR